MATPIDRPRGSRTHSVRAGTCALLLVLSAYAWPAPRAASAEAEPDPNAHYLVIEVADDGRATPVFHRAVMMISPPRGGSEAEARAARELIAAGEPYLVVRTEDDSGRTVFTDVLQDARWLRGEFHGERDERGGWTIEAERFPLERSLFVARVPTLLEGDSLVLESEETVRFRVHELEPISYDPAVHDWKPRARAIGESGDPANRADLLIMGDGYTASEQAKFEAQVAEIGTDFLGVTPFAEYRSYVNLLSLFTASTESGADHPPYDQNCTGDDRSCCSDPTMLGDPLAGTYVDTAFNGRFCAFQVHRLPVVDTNLVFAAASSVPDWDKILVLLNDATYGGSGGTLLVSSTHALAVDVVRHEYGHSFTGLADEYDTPFPGFPGCSDVTSSSCEANVTDQTVRELIKWEPWIDPSTPVPTPENSPTWGDEVGLFEGARYQTTGMYRPRDACLMRLLGVPFGEVCTQEYVLRLYNGGWGDPGSGIDMIEPGSESPPPGTVESEGDVLFSVDLLQPTLGFGHAVSWRVDGVPQPGETSETFLFRPEGSGVYEVELEVEDITSFVRAEMAGSTLTRSRSWTVEVSQGDTEIPCDDIFRFQTRCQARAQGNALQARVVLTDSTHDGETVEISFDGSPMGLVISGKRAQGSATGATPGDHVLELTDPSGCVEPAIVSCP